MSSGFCVSELPEEITRSRIFAHGGFLLFPDLLAPDVLNELEAEAGRARLEGVRTVWAAPDAAEDRGGNPDRAFTTAQGGEVQWGIFSAPTLVARLTAACGLELSPPGGGSYSYYEEPGDFLGLHRDIVRCDLTVICCLRAVSAEPGAGGLLVYSGHINAPLAGARAAGKTAAMPTPIGRGESIALLGGFVPHEVTPLLVGQERIVSIMCYEIPNVQSMARPTE